MTQRNELYNALMASIQGNSSYHVERFLELLDSYVDAKIEAAITEHKTAEEELAYHELCGEDM